MGCANYWGGPVTTGSQHYARLLADGDWSVAYLSDPVSPFHPLRFKSRVYNRDKFRLWRSGGSDDRLRRSPVPRRPTEVATC